MRGLIHKENKHKIKDPESSQAEKNHFLINRLQDTMGDIWVEDIIKNPNHQHLKGAFKNENLFHLFFKIPYGTHRSLFGFLVLKENIKTFAQFLMDETNQEEALKFIEVLEFTPASHNHNISPLAQLTDTRLGRSLFAYLCEKRAFAISDEMFFLRAEDNTCAFHNLIMAGFFDLVRVIFENNTTLADKFSEDLLAYSPVSKDNLPFKNNSLSFLLTVNDVNEKPLELLDFFASLNPNILKQFSLFRLSCLEAKCIILPTEQWAIFNLARSEKGCSILYRMFQALLDLNKNKPAFIKTVSEGYRNLIAGNKDSQGKTLLSYLKQFPSGQQCMSFLKERIAPLEEKAQAAPEKILSARTYPPNFIETLNQTAFASEPEKNPEVAMPLPAATPL